MQARPEITGQVFDLPHIVDGARKAAADAGLAERFTATGGDFFAGPLPAADYYLLKWVLRDCDDAKCVSILRNVRPVRRPAPGCCGSTPGVPAIEVARRAGHGIAVLLKIYARCIDGQTDAANKRITDAVGTQDTQPV